MVKQKTFFKFFGALFIVTGAVAITYSITTGMTTQVIWYCYAALIINGIALLRRDGTLIGSQLMVLTVPYIAWNVDFFYQLITDTPLWGITSYFFIPGLWLPKLTTLQHIITIPILLYALSHTKMRNKDAWKLGSMTIVIVFILSRAFTQRIDNVNCVYHSCITFITLTVWYPLFWFIAMLAMMGATYYFLIRFELTET